MGVLERVKVAIWGAAPETKEERRLLFKIDAFVLSFLCLMYWSNYLNRTNLNFAYISGMEEEIGFKGNDLTFATTIFTVGYTIGQIPHAFAIHYFPARIYFPMMCVIWGVLSCALSAVHNVNQVYAIRFMQALAESSTFSGAHWLLGAWYKEAELGKRSGLFACCAQLGSLFSGFMQGAIYSSLNGHGGRSGWRWTFIIDGLLAIVIAAWGALIFPDTPGTTKAFYLTPAERALAVSRLPPKPAKAEVNRKALKSIIFGWRFWSFGVLFMVSSELVAYGYNGVMPLWLKSEGYSVEHRSYYALGLTAVAIVTTVVAGILTDIWPRQRWTVNIFMTVTLLVSSIMLLVWKIPRGAKFFAFYLGGCGYAGQGSNFAWANEVSRNDLERSLLLYGMNLFSNATTAWWILIFWPVTTAPRYRRGMIVMIPLAILTTAVAFFMHLRDKHVWRPSSNAKGVKTGNISANGENRDENATVEKVIDSRQEPNRDEKME